MNDLKIICDKEQAGTRVTISETADKSACYVTVTARTPDSDKALEDICACIKDAEITAEIDIAALQAALEQSAEKSEPVGPVLACQGLPPAAGTDGACEVLFDRNDPYVEKGDVLLRITPPVPGKPGTNIYGNVIEPDKPGEPKISTGQHVGTNSAGEYISDIYGRAVFEENFLAVHKVIDITVSDDAMQVFLSCADAKDLTAERIAGELQALNITGGIDQAAVDAAVARFNEDRRPLERVVIVAGEPPHAGRDGTIDYFFETSGKPHFAEREDGSIDLRETNLVQCVAKGSELAAVTPHREGVPGKDVFGRTVPVPQVRKASLAAGKNVGVSEDGLHFFAETGGRPLLEAGRLSISEQLVIAGDLDMSVGNIDFEGEVEIKGDVEDGYRVKATRSVVIHGFVGASEIEAGEDIIIDGGCNGRGKSHLISGRDIRARYIDEARIIATGDVVIQNELINAYIRCLGRVTVQQGKICGGKIMAKKGIESFDLGAEVGTVTVLKPGHDFELKDQCRALEKSMVEKHAEMEKVKKIIDPLLHNPAVLENLPPDKREKFDETLRYIESVREEIKDLHACKEDLMTERLKDSLPEVIARHYVHPGVLLKIGAVAREITSQLEGPLRMYEDQRSETVSVEPYGGAAQETQES